MTVPELPISHNKHNQIGLNRTKPNPQEHKWHSRGREFDPPQLHSSAEGELMPLLAGGANLLTTGNAFWFRFNFPPIPAFTCSHFYSGLKPLVSVALQIRPEVNTPSI